MLLEKHGSPRVSTYPACARFKSGGGRHWEVRLAADIPVGIAGSIGKLAAILLEADIPSFLSNGTLMALGGQPDISSDMLSLRKRGADIPLKIDQMRHYVLSVVAFGDGCSKFGRGPMFGAPYFEWAFVNKGPNLSYGGSHLPFTAEG